MTHHPVVIIGAGAAGLSCARHLQHRGVACTILEASDGVGGRVRTDAVDGFRLDRGFQIFLTSYPEARQLLDYPALDLRAFRSGATIRDGHQQFTLLNPLKEPLAAPVALFAPIGTLADKLRLLPLALSVINRADADFFAQPGLTTLDYLRQRGWSERMIHRFFRPFFGGVFLERELRTSSNFFRFVFKHFVRGEVTIPALGIGAIADQLAAPLPPDCARLKAPVQRVADGRAYLASGEVLTPRTLILATDPAATARLLGQPAPPDEAFNATTCTYFAAPRSPLRGNRLLTIHCQQDSAVHNLCVPSDVAPGCAPAGQSLVSVSTHGARVLTDAALTENITRELTGWYGAEVATWRHLRTYRLPQALTRLAPSTAPSSLRLADHLYRCGDYLRYPSLNAALQAGREVAEVVAQQTARNA